MSWKGLQKAVQRLPHTLMGKKSDGTSDPEYLGLEKRFKDFNKLTEALANDARVFRDQISALLTSQVEMTKHISTIYDVNIGIGKAEGAVQKRFAQTPAQQLQATNDAEAAMAYCRDEVLPELDTLDATVTRPLNELQEIVKIIDKTMLKREHKLIDYDRHRIALQKLNAKTERSFSEEKQIFKVQAQLETATTDYNYLNDMLKRELPIFFQHKVSVIEFIFEKLYNMQALIYGMIYARCYELLNQNLEAFVTNSMGIQEGYDWKQSQYNARTEMENLDLLKSGGKAWLAASGGANSSKLTLQERAALKNAEAEGNGHLLEAPRVAGKITYGNASAYNAAPPAYGDQYSQNAVLDVTPMNQYEKQPQHNYQNAQKVYVIALYDYVAQAEGDLSFSKDDRIEIIERKTDANDWWTGRLNGQTGVFPGNYVADL